MMNWFFRLILFCIFAFVLLFGISSFRMGYFSIPNMPEGSYAISTKGGLRGVILNAEVSTNLDGWPKFMRRISYGNPERRYLGVPHEIAPWFEDAWSICSSPEPDEPSQFQQSMTENMKEILENAKLEAVCRIEVDGKQLLRGLIYSVPKL